MVKIDRQFSSPKTFPRQNDVILVILDQKDFRGPITLERSSRELLPLINHGYRDCVLR